MNAFHSCWSAPFRAKNPDTPFFIPPFELLTTVLSALFWRKYNGSISMHCDKYAAEFYDNIGIKSIWNDGIHLTLDNISPDISPTVFWAAGKLHALSLVSSPCFMIDTDFIVWKPICHLVDGYSVAAIHSEDINPSIYPDFSTFSAANDFDFSVYDPSIRPANTAFSFFGNSAFKQLYTDTALSFMKNCKNANNSLTYMVFAEQRLLAMLAHKENSPILYFSDLKTLFSHEQNTFTHTWGFKQQMLENPELLDKFCTRCAKRIQDEFKDFADILSNVASLAKYFN